VRFPAADSTRVVFVTATDIKVNTVLITGCVKTADGYAQEWQQSGFIGENGFAPEGQLGEREYRSPTGSFTVTEALGRTDPGSKLKYHTVNPASRWGGPGSPSYNNYVENGSATDENLWYWMNEGTYAQAAVINYNRLPDTTPVPGADYAIFFGAGNAVSAGCVSTTLETATQVVKTLAPGDRFIMGVVNDVFVSPPPTITVSPPAASSLQSPPPDNQPTSVQQSSTTAAEEAPVLVPLGILLIAIGGTAVFVFFTLRNKERNRGRRSQR
jgi:L,D-peptidoglycan transpeptidase YkuD (ErfK/YbiS/YcfS/YnhG family)